MMKLFKIIIISCLLVFMPIGWLRANTFETLLFCYFTTSNCKCEEKVADVAGFPSDFEFKMEKKERIKLDLFCMSFCPFTKEALPVISEIANEFKEVMDFNLHFIVSVHQDKIKSMHGEEEVEEDRIQAVIFKFFPQKFFAYALCRKDDVAGFPWQECAIRAGLDAKKIAALADEYGDKILKDDYELCRQKKVNSSPTLFINHVQYTGGIYKDRLKVILCRSLTNKNINPCFNLPECIDNRDCRKEGYIGICDHPATPQAKCRHIKDTKITATLLYDTLEKVSRTENIIKTTESLFPQVEIKKIDINSKEGEELYKRYSPLKIPALLFDPIITKAYNFPTIKAGLNYKDGFYYLNPERVGANILPERDRIEGSVLISYTPLTEKPSDFIANNLNALSKRFGEKLSIKFNLRIDAEGKLQSLGGKASLEEMERAVAVRLLKPELFIDYLVQRAMDIHTSYWEEAIINCRLNPKKVKEIAKSPMVKEILEEDAKFMRQLGEFSDFILFENKEIIYFFDEPMLEKFICKYLR